MAKVKFYAVKDGRIPGVYKNWDDCKKQVDGYKGAKYKSFPNEEEAKNYLLGIEETQKEISHHMQKDEVIAYVDGSFNSETVEYAYGVVLLLPDGSIQEFSGKDNKQEVATMRNVAGELKGSMFIVNYVVKNLPNIKKITIYHDYLGIANWVNGSWKTNLEYTTKYKEYMNKQNIEICFKKVDAHTGVTYNELADKLAKKELGIK